MIGLASKRTAKRRPRRLAASRAQGKRPAMPSLPRTDTPVRHPGAATGAGGAVTPGGSAVTAGSPVLRSPSSATVPNVPNVPVPPWAARSPAASPATANAPAGRAGPDRGRAPGLDGVRALAVLAVIAFHEGMHATPGGFLGVDIFFVLSGFLITDLLVARKDRLGRLDLRGFWTRRARRLLPALAVVLVTVTAAVAVIEPGQLTALRPVLLAAVTYSSNWYQALHHVSYFATFGPPPPLQHLWSLAIEEQFYLFWPLILAVVLTGVSGRRARALVAWLGAAASAVGMILLYSPGADPSRVYYGTDTHATALLVGCAIALTWPLASLTSASGALIARLDLVGLAGLAVLAWAVGHYTGADPAVYPAGLALAALAAAGLVAAAAAPGTVGNALSVRPLRWLGVRSYGIYLWHWPVIALTAAVIGPGHIVPWLWPAEAGLAIALAAASWNWIEAPILREGFLAYCRAAYRWLADSVTAARRSPVRALPVVLAAAALSVACTAGYGVIHPPATPGGLQQQVAAGERVSAASRVPQAAPSTPAGSSAQPTPQPAGPSGQPAPGQATTTSRTGPQAGTAMPKIKGSQVTAVGDSVMLASAAELAHALPGIYIDAQVSRQFSAGLALVQRLASRGSLRPVVVVGLGTNGTVTSGQISALLHILGPHRKLVLINTYEARPWEHEVNRTIAAAAHNHPNLAVIADWLHAIEHRTGLLWSDGVHPRTPGARLYARVIAAAVQSTRALSAPPPPLTRVPNRVQAAPR